MKKSRGKGFPDLLLPRFPQDGILETQGGGYGGAH